MHTPPPSNDTMVCVPFVSLKRLKAMHLGTQTQQWQGVVPLLQNFTNEALAETLKWMKAITDLKMVMEDTKVHKPPKLTECVLVQVHQVVGALSNNIPWMDPRHCYGDANLPCTRTVQDDT